MNSLTDVQKKSMLELLEAQYKKLQKLEKNKLLLGKKVTLKKLYDHRVLLDYFRRFTSPRKFVGKFIDRVKNKFYYETEYFVGDIVARQERFNNELIEYLGKMEKEIDDLKKENEKLKKKMK